MRDEGKRGPRAILIAGPTASGKSALAMRYARRFGGRIINADSMQVYRDLAILTVRPSAADMAAVPHALYGTIDGATTHSVSLWLADTEAEIARAETDGLVPVIVGGTGLYFKALTQGLSKLPEVPAMVREDIRAWAAQRPVAELHAELARRDPLTAGRLRPTDPQRILRALEVHAATGQSLARLQERRGRPTVDPTGAVAVALSVDRPTLRARIDARFDRMIEAGALDEVSRLAARALDPALPVMRAIGVPPLLQHLAGVLGLDAAIDRAKLDTRQYLKRQETFLRHQLPGFSLMSADRAEAALEAAQSSE